MRHVFPDFAIEVIPARERVILAVTGELDLDTAAELQARLDEVRASGFDQVLVDLREVTFLDSTGIALLLNENNKPGAFAIAYSDGAVKLTLELAGLLGRFDTRPVAVEALPRSGVVTERWVKDLSSKSVTA